MASLPSSSPPPSPPSASNSQNSATLPTPPPLLYQVDGSSNNGVVDVVEEKPDLEHLEILDSEDYIEKYENYEANYTRRLTAKYFSKKNLYGGNIFDEKMMIDGEIIMSSRWPCTRSFADPVESFEDHHGGSSSSTSTEETPTNISNGKHPLKKNC